MLKILNKKYGVLRMERCNICQKNTKTKELFWENGRQILRNVCINPKCKSYIPYVQYSIGKQKN